jgi:hypothetical protein
MIRAGGRLGRTPDGIAILEDGREVAIELELTPKRAVNYRRIFSDYEEQVDSGEVDAVRFYFSSPRVMERVAALSARHDLLDGFLEFRVYEPVFEKRR